MQEIMNYCKKLRLLYVEDNEQARTYTLELLSRFFGHIDVAANGEEGVEQFRQNDYDLVMSDINMPHMNGMEMVAQITAINPLTPVIMLSAHSESHILEEAETAGAKILLQKPVSAKGLIDALKQLKEEAFV